MSEPPILDPQQIQMLIDLDPGGASALIAELVQIFEEDVPKQLQALEDALGRGSAEEAAGVAHALKGGGSNLGLVRLAAIAKEVERMSRNGHPEGVRTLMPGLREACREALAALKRTYLKG